MDTFQILFSTLSIWSCVIRTCMIIFTEKILTANDKCSQRGPSFANLDGHEPNRSRSRVYP